MEQQKFDVVVIGSGIGGLGAAVLLSNRGYRTLVVEKAPSVGGRCSSMKLDGFTLPTGAVAIHHHGTAIETIFKEAGAPCDLIDVPTLYYRIGGKDYKMPAKGSLSVGFDIINKLEEDKTKIIGGFARVVAKETVMGAFRLGVKATPKESAGPTFKDWLLQYTDNELAHGIFDTITNSVCGGHSYEVAANAVFAWFTRMGGARNVAVAPYGNLANLEKLGNAVAARGGMVWTNTPAKKVNVSGGAARGLTVERDGRESEILCQAVVSDVGPRATVEMTGESCFSEEYLRNMRVKLRPHPVTMAFVGSDRPLWPDDGEAALLQIVGARRLVSAIPLSSISPALAPPGQHLTYCFGGPVCSEVHMDFKVEEQQVLLDLKEQFPAFEKHGRLLKIIFKDIDDPLPEARSRLGSCLPVETPVKNLYNVGEVQLAPVHLLQIIGCHPFAVHPVR